MAVWQDVDICAHKRAYVMGLAISLSEEAIYAEKNEQEPIK